MKNSWFNILSVFGAGLLIFLCFVTCAGGGWLIHDGHTFHGVAAIIAGVLCGISAWPVYRNHDKKERASKPGVKIEELKNKEDEA